MTAARSGPTTPWRQRLLPVLTGPPVLAFLPAATLAAFWLAGETGLLVAAITVPMVFALSGGFAQTTRPVAPRDSLTGLLLREGFDEWALRAWEDTATNGKRSASFLIQIDGFKDLADSHGQIAADLVVQRCGERLLTILRDSDCAARVGDGRFAVGLAPVRHLDLPVCIQMAGRMQATFEEPVIVDGLTIYVSASVGFCLRSRAPGHGAASWLDATSTALTEAEAAGPSGIRAFSAEMHRRCKSRAGLRDDAVEALHSGQIQPWYQPQISTDTGRVTGFEALARWTHPSRGQVPPSDFLPALEAAGLMERLGEVMLYHALTALKAWDSAGCDVPCVGVNFASYELRNPQLVDKVKWELDRFGLAPDRLSVEILETVVTDAPDDVVSRNIIGLGDLGCRIDLDDFGTGHASIASIRRFPVRRIKIDRSFVMKSDRDQEQQRLIGAILTMAERLDLETLAEGVETVGEHALLSQLGCTHVQGFGIGRPMPFEQTMDWIAAHEAKLQTPPDIKRGQPQ